MKISIVIPCLNARDDLPGQLAALASQDVDFAWEVVVADNGSTDGTPEVARRSAQGAFPLRVIDASQQRGAPHALNLGISAAAAPSVVLLDADDEAAPGYLAAMADALDRHDLVAARFDSDALNDPATVAARGRPQQDGLLNAYRFLPYAGGGGLGVSRRLFDEVGGFDAGLRWCYELDFCWRAQSAGFALSFVPDATVRIRFRTDAMSTFRQSRNWASVEPVLYARYRSVGMPRSALRDAVRGWARSVVRVGELLSPTRRLHYARVLGKCVGRLEGSYRQRVVYL